MQHLFSPAGDAAIAAVMCLRPLLAFDFDGTLAPIVARPEDARVPPAIARRLERLTRLLPLAIVSGRAVDDLRALLPFEPSYVIGNHGAEDPLGPHSVDPMALDTVRARLAAAAGELQAAGVLVEDKRQSMALHYRLARDRDKALQLVTRLAADFGPSVSAFGGKLVMNIVAAGSPDKADALAQLVERCQAGSAVFVGDDINDEPVFTRAEPTWLTVRVGRDNPRSRAMYRLDSVIDVVGMLDRFLLRLRDDGVGPT
jgi:trehalose 6-phosphate phosphatase